MTKFSVQDGDVIQVTSDLLLLKYAQRFYGADKAVASRLVSAGLCIERQLQPQSGDFVIIETKGVIAPKRVLFLGVTSLTDFTYNQMRIFANRAIKTISDLGTPVHHITTTVHGTGYGLDGGESLQCLVRGFLDGLAKQNSETIQRITFLTLGERSERMLNNTLKMMEIISDSTINPVDDSRSVSTGGFLYQGNVKHENSQLNQIPQSIEQSAEITKKRVFVALPFSEEFQNVYEYGIYPAVRNCGFICERVDETHFTGDILGRIQKSIETSDIVIADLTEGRPNVYLEVGYAWGKGVPVIFVARKGEKLHFDVSTHRCIFYGRFNQFAKDLEELINGIAAKHVK